jgi:murein DD-endopeptidase MepM/ murein hydrolase activator NlpD
MHRRRLILLIALAAATSFFLTSPALGDPASDKQRVDQQLAQSRAALEGATAKVQASAAAYFAASQQLPAAQAALAQAQGKVAAAEVISASAAREAAEARSELLAAEARLATANAQVEDARATISGFAAGAYMGADASMMNALLGASSPSDLVTRIAYLDTVSDKQRQALEAVTKARQAAAVIRNVVDQHKRDADTADARARSALAGAQTAEQVSQSATAKVQGLVAQRQQALAVANTERITEARRTAQLAAESNRIGAELRAIAAADRARRARAKAGGNSSGGGTSTAVPSGGGYFLKPVVGWKSSDFGYRYDPYFKVWQLHAGTDFAAPSGAPIHAAAAGTVVRAGWNGGYGNYTCIYHGELSNGRGIATCYAHQSRILVHQGQHVGRGELIGRVGTTGASTGNHLHFEVRLDGTPVNPLSWL